MKVNELVKKLLEFDMYANIEICCYTSIGDPEEMVIYDDIMDKNGNAPCQVRKEISYIGLEIDKVTVCIS